MQQDAHYHVLLRIAWVLTTQIALHHILIQSVGGYHGEGTCQELLPEVLFLVRIVEEEDAAPLAAGDVLHHIGYREMKVACNVPDTENHREQQAQRLEGVCPDERLHASAEGVEPHHQHGEGCVQHEGQAQWCEDEQLHGEAHQEQAHRGTQHLADEEHPSPREVPTLS